MCEVHPDNGIIEPNSNFSDLVSNYLPWLPDTGCCCFLFFTLGIVFHTLHNQSAVTPHRDYRPVILLKRANLLNNSAALNQLLFNMAQRLCYKIKNTGPCTLTGLDVQLRLPGKNIVEVCMTTLISFDPAQNVVLKNMVAVHDLPDQPSEENLALPAEALLPRVETGMRRLFPPSFVFLTPLARINGYRVKKYCGLVVLHFIREGSTALEETAINNYSHKFLLEVIAVTKAHVKCIGGNALLSFHLLPQETAEEDVSKAYSMITISGDAALMEEDSWSVCSTNKSRTEALRLCLSRLRLLSRVVHPVVLVVVLVVVLRVLRAVRVHRHARRHASLHSWLHSWLHGRLHGTCHLRIHSHGGRCHGCGGRRLAGAALLTLALGLLLLLLRARR